MKNLRMKLFISLIAFALILVAVIFYVNRQILLTDIQKQAEMNRTLIENHILTDMQTVDNAHYYFDNNISDQLKEELQKMIVEYQKNPDVSTWNLKKMKAAHGMEVYIIDQKNTVIYTTFEQDKGLNFAECCQRFSKTLDDRRASGKFYTDGIDIATATGDYRKYGYLATPDKKYIFELGVYLREDKLFQTFNFEKTAHYLVGKYIDLLEIQTINAGGVFFNDSNAVAITVQDQSAEFQKQYQLAKTTMYPAEYQKKFNNGYVETYRFLPYRSDNVRGEASERVIYVKYGNIAETQALAKNTKQFWFVLGVALTTSFIMLAIINKLMSNTIRLATFDPLTNVYNRATYIMKMNELLKKKNTTHLGLLLVDLDNFKKINDQFGHMEGDKVLITTAKLLQQVVGKKGFVVRFGGDEFAVVLYKADEKVIQQVADAILEKFRLLKYQPQLKHEQWSLLSISMGGATLHPASDTERSLFERADKALYVAKSAGKDQYAKYEEVAADQSYYLTKK
ncbi:GGDEF domain-containing protein [Lysinibacillus piscis]|uniref:GGDEF domain-containing protein n=1 Tax=Lysinibacillus piscis TaxID=2518931 RepID=A0ABQ5NIK2_9BACI|nr:GGDEF domain-containing protein [Lysinibacillus sp. KH24]GLC88183.1 hypothetical protein LYSBPC_13100 [Lysinibacillus sp. KH24]